MTCLASARACTKSRIVILARSQRANSTILRPLARPPAPRPGPRLAHNPGGMLRDILDHPDAAGAAVIAAKTAAIYVALIVGLRGIASLPSALTVP